MSDKHILVKCKDEFVEYLEGKVSCEAMEGEEFVATLHEESGEYFAKDSKGREMFVGDLDEKDELVLEESFELVVYPPFGSYAAHQPNYEGFKQLGKLDDYVYQSLAHMGNASHHLSWGLTVLDHTDVPTELREEIRQTGIAIHQLQEKLREYKK
ncbi:hypothetical protein NYE47_00830 [Paenibacillus sp. FSL H7-0941]|uniref:hypothetical protein n=1 Tax=Paenibacillus sp. FSL H7-0941 TaxID=2975351 RepID=UPI0030FA1D4A